MILNSKPFISASSRAISNMHTQCFRKTLKIQSSKQFKQWHNTGISTSKKLKIKEERINSKRKHTIIRHKPNKLSPDLVIHSRPACVLLFLLRLDLKFNQQTNVTTTTDPPIYTLNLLDYLNRSCEKPNIVAKIGGVSTINPTWILKPSNCLIRSVIQRMSMRNLEVTPLELAC